MNGFGKRGSSIYQQRGWRRHLRSVQRVKSFKRLKHVRKFGPISIDGREKRKQNTGYFINCFRKFRSGIYNEKGGKRSQLIIPKDFCFIENPEKSLESIWEAVEGCLDYRRKVIN
tara:strand:+ start:588 stop:932 length:345 start_codon:yes stop_codon:yes gene_type:complete